MTGHHYTDEQVKDAVTGFTSAAFQLHMVLTRDGTVTSKRSMLTEDGAGLLTVCADSSSLVLHSVNGDTQVTITVASFDLEDDEEGTDG